MASSQSIGGVVATLSLDDSKFIAGLNRSAKRAKVVSDELQDRFKSSRKEVADAPIRVVKTQRTANDIAEAQRKYNEFARARRAEQIKSISDIGRGLGFGEIVEKIGKVTSGISGMTAALGGVGAVAMAAGAAVAAVGSIGLVAWLAWKEGMAQVNHNIAFLNGELDDQLKKLNSLNALSDVFKTQGIDLAGLNKSAEAAAKSVGLLVEETEGMQKNERMWFEQAQSLNDLNSQLKITTALSAGLSKIQGIADAKEREAAMRRLEREGAEAAAVESVRVAVENLNEARRRAAGGPELVSTPELEAATEQLAEMRDKLDQMREGLKSGAFGLSSRKDIPTDMLKLREFATASLAEAQKKFAAEVEDMDEFQKASAKNELAAKKRSLLNLEALIKGTEKYAAASKVVAEQQKKIADANAAQNAERRKAEADASRAEVNRRLAEAQLDVLRQRQELEEQSEATATRVEAATVTQTEKVRKLGDAWERVKGFMVSISEIANAAEQSSNRDLARRIEVLRERQRQSELAGRFKDADRAGAQADRLEARTKRRERGPDGKVIDRAAETLNLQRAEATRNAIGNLLGGKNVTADQIKAAERMNAEMTRRGFGDSAIDDMINRAKSTTQGGAALTWNAMRDSLKNIDRALGGFAQSIGVTIPKL